MLTTLKKERFENIVGIKEENAGNQHYLLFPQYFQSSGFALAVKKLSPSLSPNDKSWGQTGDSWGQILRSWGQMNNRMPRQNFRQVGVVRCCISFIMYATG